MRKRLLVLLDVLRVLKGFANPRPAIEFMIKANIDDYRLRAQLTPERDPNAWLAQTLGVRLRTPDPSSELYRATAALSLVKEPEVGGPTALSVLFYVGTLYKNFPRAFPYGEGLRPKRWQVIQEYIAIYNDLLRPVERLARTGRVLQRWRDVNPWTAASFPNLHESSDETDWNPMVHVVTNVLFYPTR